MGVILSVIDSLEQSNYQIKSRDVSALTPSVNVSVVAKVRSAY
ncbi:hypothetical protein JCM19235_6042 [Vibrio maritimus]|uniref:Uncharacterized protein n=1 Tax=Vibrio maritimus TaxID=990268 RepID=A0A090RSK0_9VIBR|nr:hypothetical protein JCM19235_6042 [Vibrio maritimus]